MIGFVTSSLCLLVTLSPRHFVTPSLCPIVTLSPCNFVTFSLCHHFVLYLVVVPVTARGVADDGEVTVAVAPYVVPVHEGDLNSVRILE